jgi:hypothetical protein
LKFRARPRQGRPDDGDEAQPHLEAGAAGRTSKPPGVPGRAAGSFRWIPRGHRSQRSQSTTLARSRGLVLILGVCGMGVCAVALSLGGSSSIGALPSVALTATYALKQIDGHNLPAGGSFGELVIEGSLQLKPDGGPS